MWKRQQPAEACDLLWTQLGKEIPEKWTQEFKGLFVSFIFDVPEPTVGTLPWYFRPIWTGKGSVRNRWAAAVKHKTLQINHVCNSADVGVLIALKEIYNARKLLIPARWIQAWNKLPGRDKEPNVGCSLLCNALLGCGFVLHCSRLLTWSAFGTFVGEKSPQSKTWQQAPGNQTETFMEEWCKSAWTCRAGASSPLGPTRLVIFGSEHLQCHRFWRTRE